MDSTAMVMRIRRLEQRVRQEAKLRKLQQTLA
jgi:hypothetical protein